MAGGRHKRAHALKHLGGQPDRPIGDNMGCQLLGDQIDHLTVTIKLITLCDQHDHV